MLMCKVLEVTKSGFYKWLAKPLSDRAQEDQLILKDVEHFFKESHETYGSPRIYHDLKEAGWNIGQKRVARLMRQAAIRPIRSYKRKYQRYSKPDNTHPNLVNQEFTVPKPDKVWVTDITQIQTYEGWLYLAVVEDLCTRAVVGYSIQGHMKKDLVLDALTMAVFNRMPKSKVIIHSDQGSQYGSDSWKRFCRDHNLEVSMSRRGNCFDNATIESFNSTIKKEKIKGKIYKTRNEARAEVFEYIETFYNSRRRHSHLGFISPMEFEKRKFAA
jgi:putative transposase